MHKNNWLYRSEFVAKDISRREVNQTTLGYSGHFFDGIRTRKDGLSAVALP